MLLACSHEEYRTGNHSPVVSTSPRPAPESTLMDCVSYREVHSYPPADGTLPLGEMVPIQPYADDRIRHVSGRPEGTS